MSTHNLGFYEDLTKIIFELSLSNMHLIYAAEYMNRDFHDATCMIMMIVCIYICVGKVVGLILNINNNYAIFTV